MSLLIDTLAKNAGIPRNDAEVTQTKKQEKWHKNGNGKIPEIRECQ